MSRLNVNPTRMELKKLKARLKTAVRGHKLLKDKSDEMVRRFMSYIKENKLLREKLEPEITGALKSFLVARAAMLPQESEEAVAMPAASAGIKCGYTNIMGISAPKITVRPPENSDLFPYSFISTKSGLDTSIAKISSILADIIKLAEIEKTCNMLADEIEKNRRRVNALQYVLIPQIEETIRYIAMKLEENERGSLIRLMKVKRMIEDKAKNSSPGQ